MTDERTRGSSRRRFLGGLAAIATTAGGIGTTSNRAEARGLNAATGQVGDARLDQVRMIRAQATDLATGVDAPRHRANDDESAAVSYAMSFTKGLPHDRETGLVDRPRDYEQFVAAIESGASADFRSVPLGPRRPNPTDDGTTPEKVRGWETPSAGLCFNLVGHDPQSLTMPPAPRAGSAELIAEMAELYAHAILRDEPLTSLRHDAAPGALRDEMIDALNGFRWFNRQASVGAASGAATQRRRTALSPQTVFRGLAPGERTGPYLSQLLLVGTPSGNRGAFDGLIEYGAQQIDQRVRRVQSVDFMTDWNDWMAVNEGLQPTVTEFDTGTRRFITTGRDLATYVHSDALYQAYLNASLILLGNGVPLDPSLPYRQNDATDHQQGFALFAHQHVLSLLGEVSDRALKTVLFQKFNVHRRLRPEALAARIDRHQRLDLPRVTHMARELDRSPIAEEIRRRTQASSGAESMLLPMAYAEGSPMHPSYGAGHATVAGACVTILKTFFDHTRPFAATGDPGTAFVPTTDGSRLALVDVYDEHGAPAALTVEGELNKLAANISIGRDWAGVHYFSDYWESLLLGEQVAIGVLREHALTMPEPPRLVVPLYAGGRLRL